MATLYPAQVNSPLTFLASAIDSTQTTITVNDATKLPAAPNIATIGTGENAETILYTGKSGNDLTGITRGFEGTAQSWGINTAIARVFTAYDYNSVKNNQNNLLNEMTASYFEWDYNNPSTSLTVGEGI